MDNGDIECTLVSHHNESAAWRLFSLIIRKITIFGSTEGVLTTLQPTRIELSRSLGHRISLSHELGIWEQIVGLVSNHGTGNSPISLTVVTVLDYTSLAFQSRAHTELLYASCQVRSDTSLSSLSILPNAFHPRYIVLPCLKCLLHTRF